MAAAPGRAARPVEESPWYRVAMFSMRRAVAVAFVIVAVLVALGAPFLGARWGVPDDRVLPTTSSPHAVGDQLRTQFSADPAKSLTVVIPDVNGVGVAQLDGYAAALSRVSDVSSVSAPGGTFVGARGAPRRPPRSPMAARTSPSPAPRRCTPAHPRRSSTSCRPLPRRPAGTC